MKKAIIILTLLLSAATAGAQEKHLFRLGYGDSLFEKMAFHDSDITSDYKYSGHIFTDYHYSLTKVTSVGIQADFQSICWTEKNMRSRNYDFSVMPTVRFTWMRSSWVRLCSGLGAGVLFAFDNAGGREFAPVFDLKGIGVQIGKTHWCGSVDFGFMAAVKNMNHIYMMGSRLVSVSVNYRF